MPLTYLHRKQITGAFCFIFYLLLIYKAWNGFLLVQLQPALFNNRFDLITWLLMKTSVHQWLLNNPTGWIIFDIAFYSMPLLYWLTFRENTILANFIAVVMLIVNHIYIQCYTLYPANSIESFTAWLLFPFLFMSVNLTTFYFILNALRYFFLFFFSSAAIWKFVQGGIFNIDQMSAILLFQHKEYLTSSPGFWYTSIIYWLVKRPEFGYFLYLAATLLELFFVVGFFTKKLDRLLIICFVIFLITDHFFMRIPYYELTPFLIPLFFSKYDRPSSKLY